MGDTGEAIGDAIISEHINIENAEYDSILEKYVYPISDTLQFTINSDSSTHLMYRLHDLVSTRLLSGGIALNERAVDQEFTVGLNSIDEGIYLLYFHFTQKTDGKERSREMDESLENSTPFYIKIER